VFPVLADHHKHAIVLRVLAIRIFPADSPSVFHKRAETLAGTISAQHQNLTRSALVDFVLLRSGPVQLQGFDAAAR